MAKYTCRIEAEKSLYPVLLSNGNLIEQGDLEVKIAFWALKGISVDCVCSVLYNCIILCFRVVGIMPFGRIPSRNPATCLP